MCIPNFKFLAQFGEQTQKIRKPGQETSSLGLCGDEPGLTNREPPKAHLGLLLNVHTKFQLPSPIWREDRRGTALS